MQQLGFINMKRYFLAAALAASAVIAASPASAVTINLGKCVSVTNVAGCFFDGNIGNAADAAAAQSQYNFNRNPDIMLNFLGKSDDTTPFGSTSFADATSSSGSWSTPGFMINFIGVKSGSEFILYQLASPAFSGSWSTAGLLNKKGDKRELSHLTFFGSRSAVPEPATWGMMLLGFGIVGSALRRRRSYAIA